MTSVFNPSGTLNVSWDAADLPGEKKDNSEMSGAMTRCKNLRIDQRGVTYLRDGSSKINASPIGTAIWWIEEMDGARFSFAGTVIYEDEASLATGMTSAQWSALQYNAFNDTTKQIFALNGTDRIRLTAGESNEWGIDAPTVAPTLKTGAGSGLTGLYKAKYTYVRKVGTAIVSESNPSPEPVAAFQLNDQTLSVSITNSSDSQVTHVRIYRTLSGGDIYYLDAEITSAGTYAYGQCHQWEEDDVYIAGDGYKFTVTDSTHATENCFSWEEFYNDREIAENPAQPTYNSDTLAYWQINKTGKYHNPSIDLDYHIP